MLLQQLLVVLAYSSAANSPGPANGTDNSDLILQPPSGSTGPEKLLIMIAGAHVGTEYYQGPMEAIQAELSASRAMRLWVVVPAIPDKMCIFLCLASSLCAPLQALVSSAVAKAVRAGYGGATTSPDAFVAGHSMGGSCAANLVQGYAASPYNYSALVVMGSFVLGSDVAAFPAPVLTLGAELDGGAARPGYLSLSLASSDAAAAASEGGGQDSIEQLSTAPVVILRGLDHSSFCPGFQVPGDLWPADVSHDVSTAIIASHVAAFLTIRTQQPRKAVAAAIAILNASMAATRRLLAPLFSALALEVNYSDWRHMAPWCETAQRVVARLPPPEQERLAVDYSVYVNSSYEPSNQSFMHTRVRYNTTAGAAGHPSVMHVSVAGHNTAYSRMDLGDVCLVPAMEIGCKLASAARVAQQLNRSTSVASTCRDANAAAIQQAESLLQTTTEGNVSLARHRARGRPICLLDDVMTPHDIGPVFISLPLKISDNSSCLLVQSVALGPVALDYPLFPGVHYCKLLSPARVIDYIMIDSLKPKSGCINGDNSSLYS